MTFRAAGTTAGSDRTPPAAFSWGTGQTGVLVAACVVSAAILGGRWAVGSNWPARDAEPPARLQPADLQVDVNEADWVQFSLLPEVGDKKAKRIVELRDRLGRFRSLDELARVKGISHRILFKIRPQLILRDDEEAPATPEGGADRR